MTPPRVSLVTLRCRDIEVSARLYRTLGFEFVRHRHGSGPPHLCAEHDGFVFELYPAREDRPSSAGTRIGFTVDDIDDAFVRLITEGATVVRPPSRSRWGVRAVVRDADGHAIELLRTPVASTSADSVSTSSPTA
jgi:lactoylglutathione lyase